MLLFVEVFIIPYHLVSRCGKLASYNTLEGGNTNNHPLRFKLYLLIIILVKVIVQDHDLGQRLQPIQSWKHLFDFEIVKLHGLEPPSKFLNDAEHA